MESLKTRRSQKNAFQILKDGNWQPRVALPEKLSFIIEDKNKTFNGKNGPKQSMFIKSDLQRFLKEILWTEENAKHVHEQ